MPIPIIPIIIAVIAFLIIAFFRDRIIPIALELIIDAIIGIVFLGIIGIWIKIPKGWVIGLWIACIIVLFFAHVAKNAEGKGGGPPA